MKFPQMGCQQLFVTKFSTTGRTHVFWFYSALVLQVFVQRISPTILSSAVFALCSLLFPAFFSQMSMIRRLPGIGFTAHTALVESAVRHANMSYCSRPPWNCSLSVRCANVSSTLSSHILLFLSFSVLRFIIRLVSDGNIYLYPDTRMMDIEYIRSFMNTFLRDIL